MKRTLPLLFFTLLIKTSPTFAQTDTTHLVLGMTSNFTTLGDSIGKYCTLNSTNKYIQENKTVAIIGAERCRFTTNLGDDFYKVFYKNAEYWIDRKQVTTIDENAFDKILEKSESEREALRATGIKFYTAWYKNQLLKINKHFTLAKPLGISILDFSYYDESEYTSGTSASFEVYNPTSKTIKYLWFSLMGYNPVGDRVISKGTYLQTVKGVGPIKPGDSGKYEFDYVWFTDLVETAKIVTIKIQYTDGTFKTVTNPKAVILPKDLVAFISED